MNLRTSSLAIAAALTLAIGACGEDPPTGNNQLDPTLPTNPCDSGYASNVGPNGFVMSGSGYQGQFVRFTDFSRDLIFEEYGEPGNQDAAITFTVRDTVALPDDATTTMLFEFHLPSSKPQAHAFNNLNGDSASFVRLVLTRDGVGTKVYRSQTGTLTLDSLVSGAQAYGRFCGILQDSTSRSQIALMNGRFSAAQ